MIKTIDHHLHQITTPTGLHLLQETVTIDVHLLLEMAVILPPEMEAILPLLLEGRTETAIDLLLRNSPQAQTR